MADHDGLIAHLRPEPRHIIQRRDVGCVCTLNHMLHHGHELVSRHRHWSDGHKRRRFQHLEGTCLRRAAQFWPEMDKQPALAAKPRKILLQISEHP